MSQKSGQPGVGLRLGHSRSTKLAFLRLYQIETQYLQKYTDYKILKQWIGEYVKKNSFMGKLAISIFHSTRPPIPRLLGRSFHYNSAT